MTASSDPLPAALLDALEEWACRYEVRAALGWKAYTGERAVWDAYIAYRASRQQPPARARIVHDGD